MYHKCVTVMGRIIWLAKIENYTGTYRTWNPDTVGRMLPSVYIRLQQMVVFFATISIGSELWCVYWPYLG